MQVKTVFESKQKIFDIKIYLTEEETNISEYSLGCELETGAQRTTLLDIPNLLFGQDVA